MKKYRIYLKNEKTKKKMDVLAESSEDAFQIAYEERQKKIEASWQNIFDITPFHNDFISIGNYVQGCTWCIRPEDIISIKPIQKKEQQHE